MPTTMVVHREKPGDKKVDDRIEFALPTYHDIRCLILGDSKILLRGPIRTQMQLHEFPGVELNDYEAPIQPVATTRRGELKKVLWQEALIEDNDLQAIARKLAKYSWGNYTAIATEFSRVHKRFLPMEFAEFNRLSRARRSYMEGVITFPFLSTEEAQTLYLENQDLYDDARELKKLEKDVASDERNLREEVDNWKGFANCPIESCEQKILAILARSTRLRANKILLVQHRNKLLTALGKTELVEDNSAAVENFRSLLACLVGVVDE